MQNLTEPEKNIYNLYLKFSRHGKPYMPRKDFSDISSTVLMCIKKLNNFFAKFSHISPKDFFEAPIIAYPDEKYPDLKYFTNRGAIRTYSISIKMKQSQSPENQTESIKDGLRFLALFCAKNAIPLEQYLNHKTRNMPTWMQHYREHNINPYVLIGLGDLSRFKILEEDEKAFWAGDFFQNIDSFVRRYNNSMKTKHLVRNGIDVIKNFLKKELQISKI